MKRFGVILSALCLMYFMALVHSQVAPYITFDGSVLANNSYLNISLIGDYDGTDLGVKCLTDLPTCCNSRHGSHRGDWYYPSGERLQFRWGLTEPAFQVQGDIEVTLYYHDQNDTREGIYECRIETNAVHDNGNRENMYIALYSSGGDVTIPDGIDFCLKPDVTAGIPQFTLTCISTGGPATTVTWTRGSDTVTEGNETVLDDLVTAQYTHTLTVTGRLEGLYHCTVSNAKPSQAMAGLTVRSAEPPTNLVVSQTKPNSLKVSWVPPQQVIDVTGYRIYYDCDGGSIGSVDVAGGSHTTQVVSGLIDGVSCTVSLAALSVHLPSRLVTYPKMVPILSVPVIAVPVLRIEPTMVEIQWSAIFGAEMYEVSYERLTGQEQSGHCPKQSQSATFQYSAGATQATLSGLEEYSNYHLTVTALRGQGSLVAKETLNFMTGSAGASAPPQDVVASVMSSTSIKVSWSPIEDCSDINGDITEWKIRYYISNTTITCVITIPGSNDVNGVVILTGLLFSTEYGIEVAAVNRNYEIGVYSTPVIEATLNNAPPTLSAVFYGKNEIKVTWNQIQLDGWSSSNIVYQFIYYTKEKRYITRKSVVLPSHTTSYVVYVKDSIPELEHFFTISCNLRVDGYGHPSPPLPPHFLPSPFLLPFFCLPPPSYTHPPPTGLTGNTSFVFDKTIIQLQFGPMEHCINWLTKTRNNPVYDIEYNVHMNIREAMLQYCSECEQYPIYSILRSGVFICQSQPTMVTYRTALVNPGIAGLSSLELATYIQNWVSSAPVMKLLHHLLVRLNYDCPVVVSNFSDPECTTPAALRHDPQLINTFNSCAIQSLGTQICSEPGSG